MRACSLANCDSSLLNPMMSSKFFVASLTRILSSPIVLSVLRKNSSPSLANIFLTSGSPSSPLSLSMAVPYTSDSVPASSSRLLGTILLLARVVNVLSVAYLAPSMAPRPTPDSEPPIKAPMPILLIAFCIDNSGSDMAASESVWPTPNNAPSAAPPATAPVILPRAAPAPSPVTAVLAAPAAFAPSFATAATGDNGVNIPATPPTTSLASVALGLYVWSSLRAVAVSSLPKALIATSERPTVAPRKPPTTAAVTGAL